MVVDPITDRRRRARRRRRCHAAGPRPARRRLPRQRTRPRHRAAHGAACAVRVAFATPDEMPDTLAPLDVLGLVVPAVGGARRRRTCSWPATPRSPPASARWPPRPGHRPRLDHDRPPRLQPRASATSRCSTRPRRRPSCSSTGADGDGRPARRRRRPLPVRRARHRHRGLPHGGRGRPPAGRRARRGGRRARARSCGPLLDTHPFAWFAALARALDGCVLEPDAAGGLGLVHTAVPAADVARFRAAEIDSVDRHRPHRRGGRGRARAQAGGRSALVGFAAVQGHGRRVPRGCTARRRRSPGGGRVHPRRHGRAGALRRALGAARRPAPAS